MQAEGHPEFGEVWVHRKGATRAFPAGHPALAGTHWEDTGHPVLIPGSNRDYSYILARRRARSKSGYSVNHGAGRRMSRGEAMRSSISSKVDEQYREDGILVNLDGRVPLDESAQCYKSAEEVVEAVVAAGLARDRAHASGRSRRSKGDEERAAKERHRERKGEGGQAGEAGEAVERALLSSGGVGPTSSESDEPNAVLLLPVVKLCSAEFPIALFPVPLVNPFIAKSPNETDVFAGTSLMAYLMCHCMNR